MSKTRMVKKYTDEAMKQSQQISREDYKAVKHMDKVQLTAYLQRVYKRGYDAGYQAAVKSVAPQLKEAAELKDAAEQAAALAEV